MVSSFFSLDRLWDQFVCIFEKEYETAIAEKPVSRKRRRANEMQRRQQMKELRRMKRKQQMDMIRSTGNLKSVEYSISRVDSDCSGNTATSNMTDMASNIGSPTVRSGHSRRTRVEEMLFDFSDETVEKSLPSSDRVRPDPSGRKMSTSSSAKTNMTRTRRSDPQNESTKRRNKASSRDGSKSTSLGSASRVARAARYLVS